MSPAMISLPIAPPHTRRLVHLFRVWTWRVLMVVAALSATTALGLALRYGAAAVARGDAVLESVREGFRTGSLVPQDRPPGGACPYETYHGPDGYSDCFMLAAAIAASIGPVSDAYSTRFITGMGEPACLTLSTAVRQPDDKILPLGVQHRYWNLQESVVTALLSSMSVRGSRVLYLATCVLSHLLVIGLALKARMWQVAVVPLASLLLSAVPFYGTSNLHSCPQTVANLCAAVCLCWVARRTRWPSATGLAALYAAAGAVMFMFDAMTGAPLYGIMFLLAIVVFRWRRSARSALVHAAVAAFALALGMAWALAGRMAVSIIATGTAAELRGQVAYRTGEHTGKFFQILAHNYNCQTAGVQLSTGCIPLDFPIFDGTVRCAVVVGVTIAASLLGLRRGRWIPVWLAAAVWFVHPFWYYFFNNHLCTHAFFMGRYVFLVPTLASFVVLMLLTQIADVLRGPASR